MIDIARLTGGMPVRIWPAALWTLAAVTAINLGWSAAPVVWRLAGQDGQIIPAFAGPQATAAARTDLAPLLDFAPFGQDSLPTPEPQVTGETSLGLTLLGVTIGNPASASRAIISGGDTPVASYPVGARVLGNADVAEVNADHVVLRVDGRLETLSFADTGTATARAAGSNLRNLIPQATQAAPTNTSNAPEDVINRYRAAIQADALGVLDRLGVTPTPDGYQIGVNASPGVLQAGMRPGDVITSVNGQRVGDMEADRQYFDQVAASGRARVELQRDGQAIVMSFPLR